MVITMMLDGLNLHRQYVKKGEYNTANFLLTILRRNEGEKYLACEHHIDTDMPKTYDHYELKGLNCQHMAIAII